MNSDIETLDLSQYRNADGTFTDTRSTDDARIGLGDTVYVTISGGEVLTVNGEPAIAATDTPGIEGYPDREMQIPPATAVLKGRVKNDGIIQVHERVA